MGISCYDNKNKNEKGRLNQIFQEEIEKNDNNRGNNLLNSSTQKENDNIHGSNKKTKNIKEENPNKPSYKKKKRKSDNNIKHSNESKKLKQECSKNNNIGQKINAEVIEKKEDLDNKEIDNTKEKNNNLKEINNEINPKIQPQNEISDYSKFDINKYYYIVCPDCKTHYPIIEDISYNENIKDLIIEYTCLCFNEKNNAKNSPLINFINLKCPINDNFISKETSDKMYKLAKEKSDEIKGYNILEKIIKDECTIDRSVAPLAFSIKNSTKKSTLKSVNNSINNSIKKSNIKESDVHIEVSANYYDEGDDMLSEEIKTIKQKNKNIHLSMIKEEENDEKNEFIKYKCSKTLSGNTDKISSLIELKSGLIVTGSFDCKIIIWQIENSYPIKEIKENGIIFCLLEFEQNFVLSGNNKNEIYLWDIISGEKEYIFNFSGHKSSINCLVKCNDNIFASSSNDKTIKIWDFFGRKEIRTLDENDGGVVCLIKLKDGKLCSGSEKSIKIWDWENGECINTIGIHNKSVKCLCELDNGYLLSGFDNKNISILKNYKNEGILYGHENQVNSLFQIDKNYIASSSLDNTIKVWDIQNKRCLQTLKGHSSNVTCVIKLHNNSLASCSYDKTIKIWEQC